MFSRLPFAFLFYKLFNSQQHMMMSEMARFKMYRLVLVLMLDLKEPTDLKLGFIISVELNTYYITRGLFPTKMHTLAMTALLIINYHLLSSVFLFTMNKL